MVFQESVNWQNRGRLGICFSVWSLWISAFYSQFCWVLVMINKRLTQTLSLRWVKLSTNFLLCLFFFYLTIDHTQDVREINVFIFVRKIITWYFSFSTCVVNQELDSRKKKSKTGSILKHSIWFFEFLMSTNTRNSKRTGTISCRHMFSIVICFR